MLVILKALSHRWFDGRGRNSFGLEIGLEANGIGNPIVNHLQVIELLCGVTVHVNRCIPLGCLTPLSFIIFSLITCFAPWESRQIYLVCLDAPSITLVQICRLSIHHVSGLSLTSLHLLVGLLRVRQAYLMRVLSTMRMSDTYM